MPVFL